MNEGTIFIEDYSEGCISNRISFIKNRAIVAFKEFSYQDLREIVVTVGYFAFKVIYIFYGIVQFLVTWNALAKVFHQSNVIIWLASLVLGFTPFVGTVFGIFGAHVGWGWSLLHSIMIFFVIPYTIVNGPVFMLVFYDIYKDCKRWQAEKNIAGV